jgi:hypothetical protein
MLLKPLYHYRVFNRACLLASACPIRGIPAFGSELYGRNEEYIQNFVGFDGEVS